MSKKNRWKDTLPVDEVTDVVEDTMTEATPIEEVETVLKLNKTGVVICQNLNVREEPTIDSKILRIIPKDTVVEILDDVNETWYKVRVGEIESGFCMKEFIKVNE